MHLIKAVRKSSVIAVGILLFVLIFSCIFLLSYRDSAAVAAVDDKWYGVMDGLFVLKNKGLLTCDTKVLSGVYDRNVPSGVEAYQNEVKRAKYLRNWSAKQGVQFHGISSRLQIHSVEKFGPGYTFYVVISTEYRYSYLDSPQTENMFRTGTCHTLDLIPACSGNAWCISYETYLDSFHDSLELRTLKTQASYDYITTHPARDFVDIGDGRKGALAYADMYCGAASDGFEYNKKYPDFNDVGGDCSNFTSQVLHEGGGFKTDGQWYCSGASCSPAWGCAECLVRYLLDSSRASLITEGTYNKVYKSAYDLLPGDVIAYEEYGRIVHTAVVTGADSRGWALVDTHTCDRFHVPWDLGWDDANIRYWLLRVHY